MSISTPYFNFTINNWPLPPVKTASNTFWSSQSLMPQLLASPSHQLSLSQGLRERVNAEPSLAGRLHHLLDHDFLAQFRVIRKKDQLWWRHKSVKVAIMWGNEQRDLPNVLGAICSVRGLGMMQLDVGDFSFVCCDLNLADLIYRKLWRMKVNKSLPTKH